MGSNSTGAPSATREGGQRLGRRPLWIVLAVAALATILVLVAPPSEAAPLSGANADLAKVCTTPSGGITDKTTAALDATASDLSPLNNALNTGSSATYFGMDHVFDELTFNVGTIGVTGTALWSYWDGSQWASLSVTDNTNHLKTIGTNTVTWTPPSTWATKVIDGTACAGARYYVRITTDTSYTVLPLVTQISGQVFNLKVKVQDQLGNTFAGLSSGAFTVADGSTTTIFAFREIGAGVYEMALDSGGADVNFNLKAAKDGYVTSSNLATGALTGALTDKTGSPLSLDYAYKVTSITSEASQAIAGATVSAGNSYGTSCVESSGAYYCPVPLADTSLGIRFVKDGYVTSTATSFASDRTSALDAQVATTLSGILYALKITLPTEADLSGVTLEKKVGAGSYATATPDATVANVAYFAQSPSQADLVYRATKYSVTADTGAAFTTSSSSQVVETVSLLASLSSLSTSASSLVAGAPTQLTVSFTNAHAWPVDGKYRLTLPSGYEVTTPTVTLAGATGTGTVSVSGQVLTVTRASDGSITPTGTAISLTFSGLSNPGVSGTTGTFSAALLNGLNVDLDEGTLPTLTLTAGSLSSVSGSASSLVAGASSTLTFTFQTANAWPSTGKLSITFPSGYNVAGASPSISGADGSVATSISGQVVTLTRSGGSQTAKNSQISVALSGVTNPTASGSTGTFALSIRNALDSDIDRGTASALTIIAGSLSAVTVSPSSATLGIAQAQAFTGTPVDAYGNTVSGTVTWTSSCGSITSGGSFTAPSTAQSCTVTATVGAVTRTVSVTVSAGSLSGVSASAVSTSTGALTSYTFVWTPAHTWPADGRLAVTFPTGYTLGSSGVTLSGATGSATAAASGLVLTIVRSGNGAATSAGTPVTVTVTEITNPGTDGSPGSFGLSMQDSSGNIIDTGTASSLSITTNALSVRSLASSTHAASTWRASNSVTLTWTAPTDSTVVGYSWRADADPDDTIDGTGLSATFTGLSDGIHSLRIKAKNLAGTWGPVASLPNIYTDMTPPVVSVITSSTHAANVCSAGSTASFSWSVVDAASGLASSLPFEYQLDAGALTRTSVAGLSTSGLLDGSHTLTVRAFDRAGNVGTNSYSFKVDTTAPVVTLTAPATARGASFNVAFGSTDACTTVRSVALEVQYGSTGWKAVSISGTTGVVAYAPTQGDGRYAFRAWATDSLHNVGAVPSAAMVTVLHDTSAPDQPRDVSATIVLGGAGTRLTWAASQDALSGIDGYEVYRIDAQGGRTRIGADLVRTTEFIDADLAEGLVFNYAVRAVDKAGNPSSFVDAVVSGAGELLDAPESLTADALEDGIVAQSRVGLSWLGVEGAREYAVYLSPTPQFGEDTARVIGSTSQTRFEFEAEREGAHYLAVVARDALGNEGFAAMLFFIVDTQAPQVALRSPGASGPAVRVSWEAQDGATEVESVDLFVRVPGGQPVRFWSTPTVKGSATYFGRAGVTYEFFASATDRAGHASDPGFDAADANATSVITSRRNAASSDAVDNISKLAPQGVAPGGLYAEDTDGDGVPDAFVDPAGQLRSPRLLEVSAAQRLFVLAAANGAPFAVWDAGTDDVLPVVTALPVREPRTTPTPDGGLQTVVHVDKGGWIHIPVPDAAPGREVVNVLRGDGTPLPGSFYWREGGKLQVMDDPDQTYRIIYAPQTLAASEGNAWGGFLIGAFILLMAALAWAAWVVAPTVEQLGGEKPHKIPWYRFLAQCGRCAHILPPSHRLLRGLHDCPGLAARLHHARHWWHNAGLADKLLHARRYSHSATTRVLAGLVTPLLVGHDADRPRVVQEGHAALINPLAPSTRSAARPGHATVRHDGAGGTLSHRLRRRRSP